VRKWRQEGRCEVSEEEGQIQLELKLAKMLKIMNFIFSLLINL